MDGIQLVLEAIRDHGLAPTRLAGVFHLALGRRVMAADGSPLSVGVTWRQLARLLKDLKYDKELAREVGVDPDATHPRDREKMWYSTIALAKVEGAEASAQADQLAALLLPLGFAVAVAAPPTPPAARRKKK